MNESKASYHFHKYRYSNEDKKYHMTCKYCNVEIIDCKNSNCKVSHLRKCRPDKAALLRNKIAALPVNRTLIEVEFNSPNKVKVNFLSNKNRMFHKLSFLAELCVSEYKFTQFCSSRIEFIKFSNSFENNAFIQSALCPGL